MKTSYNLQARKRPFNLSLNEYMVLQGTTIGNRPRFMQKQKEITVACPLWFGGRGGDVP